MSNKTIHKQDLVDRAIDTHIRQLKEAVAYGPGCQPDNESEARWEAAKLELEAYKKLRAGRTLAAKDAFLSAEERRATYVPRREKAR